MSLKQRASRIAVAAAMLATISAGAMKPPLAEAATCFSLGASSIQVCGTWNATGYTDSLGIQYYKTTSFKWTVRPSDPKIIITSIDILTSGLSSCIGGNFSSCKNFNVQDHFLTYGNRPRNVTWTSNAFPSYTGQWGQTTGPTRHQGSNLTIKWYRSGAPSQVYTQTTSNIGIGPGR